MNIEGSVNPKVQKFNDRSQFWQTIFLLFLTLTVCGFLVLDNATQLFWWTTFCVFSSVAGFCLAFAYSRRAFKTYQSTSITVVPQTLSALQATNTAPDAIPHLERLQGYEFASEARFFDELEKDLGAERCSELKTQIFKYTQNN